MKLGSLSDDDLEKAKSWAKTMAEHADDNFRHGDYHRNMQKIQDIEAEQKNRARNKVYQNFAEDSIYNGEAI